MEKNTTPFDYNLISDVEFDGVYRDDHPDYSDAYILQAKYDGVEMTEEQLELLNEDTQYVYETLWERLH
jgi:hypothetical protein